MGYLDCELDGGLSSSVNCGENTAIGVTTARAATVGQVSAVTINASGICTAIVMSGGKKFQNLDFFDEVGQYKEPGKRSKGGNTSYNPEVTFTHNNWSDDARNTIDTMIRTKTILLVTLRNQYTYLVGVDNINNPLLATGLKCEAEWDSGKEWDGEFSGANVKFTGNNGFMAYRVDDSILTSSLLA